VNKVYFKPTSEFVDLANKVFEEQKKKILEFIPNALVEHIGSTAIFGSFTKGDLDINVRVKGKDFNKAIKALRETYQINQPENWTEDFASFKSKTENIDFGIQLVIKGSNSDDFVLLRDVLINHPALLKEYNKMKSNNEGKEMDKYQREKADFFQKLREKFALGRE